MPQWFHCGIIILEGNQNEYNTEEGFQNGSSKMAKRKCYGYDINPDGELEVNPEEAKVVVWIFERYFAGESLGKIAAGLEQPGYHFPYRQTQMEPGGD